MIGKYMKQANAMLEADVHASIPEQWLDLARELAEGFSEIHESNVAVPNGGVHFWITSQGKRLNGFQVWVTRVRKEEDKGKRPGSRTVYVEWHESVIDAVTDSGTEGDDDTIGILGNWLKLLFRSPKEVAGYPTFVRFVQ